MPAAVKSKLKGSIYSLHPGYEREASFETKLVERTGKTLKDWVRFVKKSGPATEKERREWLKQEHALGTNYAWWIAERAEGRGGPEDYDPEGLVEAMFDGGKAGLRPLYEALLKLGFKLGKDVKACPCRTIVPLYRSHVFAQLKPGTRTRLDLGFALGGDEGRGASDRHGRVRQEGPDHAPDPGLVAGRDR